MVIIPKRNYHWTGARMEVRRREVLRENPWRPCPTCWQQGQEWGPDEDGYYHARTCIQCLGVGQVPSGSEWS